MPLTADNRRQADIFVLLLGLFTLVMAVVLSPRQNLLAAWSGIVLFSLLYLLTNWLVIPWRFHLGAGLHNTVVAATFLSLGPAPTLAVIVIGEALAGVGRQVRPEDGPGPGGRGLWPGLVSFSLGSGLRVFSLRGGSLVYAGLGGPAPLQRVGQPELAPLVALGVTLPVLYWFGSLLFAGRQRTPVADFLGRNWQVIVAADVGAQVLAPVLALLYNNRFFLALVLFTGPLYLLVWSLRRFLHQHYHLSQEYTLLHARETESTSLYEQMKQRAAELATLNVLSRQISASLDLEAVLAAILNAIVPVMGCQKAAVFLVDEEGQHLNLVSAKGLSQDYIAACQSLAVATDPRAWIAREERARTVSDVDAPEALAVFGTEANREQARREGIKALAKVPLHAHQVLIGGLAIYFDEVHEFSPIALELLTTFANQTAIAVDNARLYSQTDAALTERLVELKRKNRQLAHILAISNALRSDLDLERGLEQIAGGVVESLGFKVAILGLVDPPARPQLRIVAGAGVDPPALAALQTRTIPLTHFTALMQAKYRLGPAYFVPHTEGVDPERVWGTAALRASAGAGAAEAAGQWHSYDLLFVPLKDRQGQLLGVLAVNEPENGRLPDHHVLEVLAVFANQAAVAVERGRLFAEIRLRVTELAVLQTVGLKIAASLEVPRVLELIAESTLSLVPADDVHIFLYDVQTDTLSFGTSLWAEPGPASKSFTTTRPDGLTYRVARSGQPIIIEDAPHHDLFQDEQAQSWHLQAIAGFPLKRGEKVLGVFNIAFLQPHTFRQDELQLLEVLATQAAIAISNAQLFREVREAHDQLTAVLNSGRNGIMVLDAEGRISLVNSIVEQLWGIPQAEAVGQSITGIARRYGAAVLEQLGFSAAGLEADLAQLNLAPHTPLIATYDLTRPAYCVFERSLSVVHNEEGQMVGYVLVWHDITESEELQKLQAELTQMLIHDLRSPLGNVLSSLALLMELGPEDADAGTLLNLAYQGSHHVLKQIDSLLDISAMEEGKIPLHLQRLPLDEIIEEATNRLQAAARTAAVQFRLEIRPDLPPVEADRNMLVRVLVNLLDNALKYSPPQSTVTIAADLDPGATPAAPVVRCRVVDQGPGIPLPKQHYIFEKFGRIKESQRGRRGIGLGLTFCKLAVEAHGGKIWVESEAGQGSTFVFTWPARPS